jgi:hypothetical protein
MTQTLPYKLILFLSLILFVGVGSTLRTTVAISRPGSANTQSSEGCWLSASSAGNIELLSLSGNAELDNAHQREGLALIGKFGVTPRGFFFDDHGAPNAYATSKVTNSLGPDGTVVFGLTLLDSELKRDGGYGLAVPAIMAHEFAHIVQFKRKSTLSTKEQELQADYLAGWYLGNRWIYTDVRAAFEAFFQMGDYQFNSPNHHGTPKQRLAAIQAGFQNTRSAFNEAYQKSSDFVKSL